MVGVFAEGGVVALRVALPVVADEDVAGLVWPVGSPPSPLPPHAVTDTVSASSAAYRIGWRSVIFVTLGSLDSAI